MSIPEPPEELMSMIRAIGDDPKLRMWLHRLIRLPDNLRVSEIGQLAAAMTAKGEDARVVEAFKMLADAEVCRAAHKTVVFLYGRDA